MKTKVYYGEYSLKHWIELIVTRNLVLPDYQRHFVWQIRDVKRLVKSLKEKQFIQPVTIALYDVGDERKNLIVDGQQRLTSILLAFIGYFPSSKDFSDDKDCLASEDDSASNYDVSSSDFGYEENELYEENDEIPETFDSETNIQQDEVTNCKKSILWRFDFLLGEKNTKKDITNRIEKDGRYLHLEEEEFTSLDTFFFENTYIGFSYIVPESKNKEEVQTCFSKMFRNINYLGKKLDFLESRRSLYYQDSNLIKYFEGKTNKGEDVLSGLTIIDNLQPSKIDFVRYLSLLSQYVGMGEKVKNVLVGYSAFSSRESYYSDYVSYVLGQGIDEQESRADKFDGFIFKDVFPDDCWLQRFDKLREAISRLKPEMTLGSKDSYSSWMEADYWLFGLIFHVLFRNRSLNKSLTRLKRKRTISLKHEIEKKIDIRKKDNRYLNNSNRVGLIRERINESCKIYANYVH